MNSLQYTIRGIPDDVDRSLRATSRATGRSLNSLVVETLTRAVLPRPDAHDDLDWFFAGSDEQADAGPEEQDALDWLDSLPTDLGR